LTNKEKTVEQLSDYIHFMVLDSSDELTDEIFNRMTESDFGKINDYIQADMTATTFMKKTK